MFGTLESIFFSLRYAIRSRSQHLFVASPHLQKSKVAAFTNFNVRQQMDYILANDKRLKYETRANNVEAEHFNMQASMVSDWFSQCLRPASSYRMWTCVRWRAEVGSVKMWGGECGRWEGTLPSRIYNADFKVFLKVSLQCIFIVVSILLWPIRGYHRFCCCTGISILVGKTSIWPRISYIFQSCNQIWCRYGLEPQNALPRFGPKWCQIGTHHRILSRNPNVDPVYSSLSKKRMETAKSPDGKKVPFVACRVDTHLPFGLKHVRYQVQQT